ncbi:MAG TPA: SCP2 sterol-binding domain-containing protein [Thermoleophilaceae bacterium]|jgi:putative sterol carrier protein
MSEPTGIPDIGADQFATLIAQADDEQIEEGLATNGDLILEGIFTRWPEAFEPARAEDVDAVVEWHVVLGGEGSDHRWQIAIRDGACTVERGGSADPDVTFRVGALEFVKLIAGVESGPRLFVFGKLKIRGNLMLAARFQGFFRTPRPEG